MPELRHGVREVQVHEIGNQGYCELQVELLHQNRHVVPASRMLENGNFGHAGLEQRDLDHQPMWRVLRRNSRTLRAEFDGVPLVGIPDYLETGHDGTTLLLEFKVTRRAELYWGRQAQANAYGYLAEVNGRCDPRRFVLGVVTLNTLALTDGRPLSPADTARVRDEIIKQTWIQARQALVKEIDVLQASGNGWNAHLWPYHAQAARETLAYALAYWTNQRDPTDAREWPRKCEACPVNAVHLCPAAAAPANAFDIIPRDGRLVVRRR